MFIPLGDDIDKRTFPAAGSILITANAVVYAYMTRLWLDSLPSGRAWLQFIMDWGLVPDELFRGHFAGLFAYMFMHGGIFHLVGNMVVLWAFVGSLEGALGATKFLALYLGWGLAAGLAHALLVGDAKMPMVGASGAIAGMIGAYFVAFGALTRVKTLLWLLVPTRVDIPAGFFVAVWVLSQMGGLSAELERGGTGVAWYAHLGGFLAGAVSMKLFAPEVKKRLTRNRNGVLQIADAEPTPPAPVEEILPGPAAALAIPPACPHCGVCLAEDERICETLIRCPSADCQRLIYLG